MESKTTTDRRSHPATWVPTLYFAEGLPFFAVNFMALIFYQRMGVSNTVTTAVVSLLAWPWTLKPVWSPLLEMYWTKKRFVILMQLVGGVGLMLLALSLPLPGYFRWSIAILTVLAFASSTHDIAADGLYIASLSPKQQAEYAGWQGASYNAARIFSMGGLVWLVGALQDRFAGANVPEPLVTAWLTIFAGLGGVLVLLGLYHARMLPKGGEDRRAENLKEMVATFKDVLATFFKKRNIWVLLVFIFLYRAGEGQVIKVGPLFLQEARAVTLVSVDAAAKTATVATVEGEVTVPLERGALKKMGELTPGQLLTPVWRDGHEAVTGTELVRAGQGDKGAGIVTVVSVDEAARTMTARSVPAEETVPVEGAALAVLPRLKEGQRVIPTWHDDREVITALETIEAGLTPEEEASALTVLAVDAERQKITAKRAPVVETVPVEGDALRSLPDLEPGQLLKPTWRVGHEALSKLTPVTAGKGGLGLSLQQFGTIYGTFGSVAFIVGSILGGYFTAWLGLKRALIPLICVLNLPMLAYWYLSASLPTDAVLITTAMTVEMFGYGFGFVGVILLMMQEIAPGKYQMAHYAFANSLMNLGLILPGAVSGWIQTRLGYQNFFIWVVLASIPALILSRFVPIRGGAEKALSPAEATPAAGQER